MFNVNDNQDEKNKNEKTDSPEAKDIKEESFDFTGFSQNQDQVLVNNGSPKQASTKSHVSFRDFEELPNTSETNNKSDEKNFDEYFEQGRAEQSELQKEETIEKKQKKKEHYKYWCVY